jgi:hypothetical protein
VAWDLPADILNAALPIAQAVPDDATRLRPGAAFAPRVSALDKDPLCRIVAFLGRSSDWKAPG